MTWIGYLKFPEHIKYLIEHNVTKLNENSKSEEWLECLAGLRKFKYYIWNEDFKSNSNIFPSRRWTMIHHAAKYKAPLSILQMMNVDRYPLSLPDSEGKLAIDHLAPGTPGKVRDLFKPSYKIRFLQLELKLIQSNFELVICDRIEALVTKYNLILPVVSVMLEDICKNEKMFFDVPGMYGGFTFWFELENNKTELVALWCRSSSRLVGNSEMLHKCTSEGWELVKCGE